MNNLKTILGDQGRSQKWLRKKMFEEGIDRNPSTISRWIKNKHTIRDNFVIDAICKILEITKEQLFVGGEEASGFQPS